MARMSLLQSGYWQPLMHGEAKGLSFFIYSLLLTLLLTLLLALFLFEATE